MLDPQEEGRLALAALATADMPDLSVFPEPASASMMTRGSAKRSAQRVEASRAKRRTIFPSSTILIGDGEVAKGAIQLDEIVGGSQTWPGCSRYGP